MPAILRAQLISFDAATWTAVVLLDGSVGEVVMPVGEWIPNGQLAADDGVAVLLFDESNPADGLVLGPYGGTGGSFNVPPLIGQPPTNGQVPIGRTSDGALVLAALTGTANQVNVSGGAGSITLSTPQNIHSGAGPTFANLTLSDTGTTGVLIGGDARLYRGAADVFRTPDSLRVDSGLNVGSPSSVSTGDIRAQGGLYAGRDADPGDGNVAYTGALKSFKNSTEYTGYIYVPITPVDLTDTGSTAWSGSASRTTGTYTFDLQAAANSLPSNLRAVNILVQGRWSSASAANNCLWRPRGGSTTELIIRSLVANIENNAQGIVRCDGTNFDIEAVVAGATMDQALCRVLGYFI